MAVKPPDLARLGRLREAQGRLEDAAETYEVAEMPADALRNWRAAGKWEQAVRLAEGQVRSDLEWLVELETLTRRRPAGQRKRLTTGEREHLVQLLDTVERLPRSGRTVAASNSHDRRAAHPDVMKRDRLRPPKPPTFRCRRACRAILKGRKRDSRRSSYRGGGRPLSPSSN